jgi:hypothetical protein
MFARIAVNAPPQRFGAQASKKEAELMIKWMFAPPVAALAVAVVGLTGAPANATPIGPVCANNSCNGGIYTLTSDGVDIGGEALFDTYRVTLEVSNTDNIIDTLGGTAPYYIDAVSIKVSSSATGATVVDAPDAAGNQGGQANWSIVNGGINAGGCSGAGGGFECADWVSVGLGALLSDGNDMSWTFDVRMADGAFWGVEGTQASIKARFVESDGTKIGALLSEDITIQEHSVPEPATLGVLGVGLIGLGFAARRRRKAA